jgi:hypothetical protein
MGQNVVVSMQEKQDMTPLKSAVAKHLTLLTQNLCACTYLRQACLIQESRKGSLSGPNLFGRAKAICNRVSGSSQDGISSQPDSRKARNNALLGRQPWAVTKVYLPVRSCKALLEECACDDSGPVQNPKQAGPKP